MVIVLPELSISEQEVKCELAIALFQQDKLTLAQAARLANVSRLDMQQLLSSRRIPAQYTRTDWEDDQRSLKAQEPVAHYRRFVAGT